MATGWEAFPLELKGGLVSNMSRLQQGIKAPGSARLLVNFEPSVKGGYRRINGFGKYSSSTVPVFGSSVAQGSGQTGTTLVVGNLHTTPVVGDTFTIDGVANTYTIASAGVSYSSTNKEATLTLTTSLDSSPADKADITFTNKTSNVEGLHYFYNSSTGLATTLAVRDSTLWSGTGSTWTNETAPDYGSVLVDGGSQTGTSLIVDAIDSDTYVPHIGTTFSIAGVEKVYTVLATPTITSGGGTLSIYPALASSPADDAAITFLSVSATGGSKYRFQDFNFDSTERVVIVDGVNPPATWDETQGLTVIDTNTDLVGASTVTTFKSHLFFGVGNKLVFSAPFSSTDYTPGNGGGVFSFPVDITGIIVFREKLIVFTSSSIHQITGSSQADFALSDISDDLGCVSTDTIAEVGGDIIFLGPDGLRFLGATARIGDFNLSLASRNIQDNMTTLTSDFTHLTGTVVRSKSQYRIFGYTEGTSSTVTSGFIGTQFSDQEATGFSWGKTSGIKAYRTASKYAGGAEIILFTGEDGYIYEMESGNTFDGVAISASFYTPFMAINDPRLRKTLYKATTYYDPEGNVTGTLTFKYDFQRPDVIQPLSGGGSFSILGSAIFGTSAYGGDPETVIETQATGSFFTVSLQYEFATLNDPSFVVDTVLLEYSNNDRK
tara:strand:- start:4150 stop:6138 length:1989 start_codon:yes stop_codon:yes gene_type:complete